MALRTHFEVLGLGLKASRPKMAVQYNTVRYASIFAKKYGTLVRYAFFVMVQVRYVGTVRLLCDSTGTVRWYAV